MFLMTSLQRGYFPGGNCLWRSLGRGRLWYKYCRSRWL